MIQSELFITLQDAALVTNKSEATIRRRIQQEKYVARQIKDKYDSSGKICYEVALASLPPKAQENYWMQRQHASSTLDLDIVSCREGCWNHSLEEFYFTMHLAKEAALIRLRYRSSKQITMRLKQLCERYHISLSTLYRVEASPFFSGSPRKIVRCSYQETYVPKTCCLLARDLISFLFLEPNHISMNQILIEVQHVTPNVRCITCPYHHEASSEKGDTLFCTFRSETMIAPANRYVVNRICKDIPDRHVCYARKGYYAWRAKYGNFALRERPAAVHACWQADHHLLDIFVTHTIYIRQNGQSVEQQVLIRPVLTAWMDTASGAIVSYAISIVPNAEVIADSFARGTVYTIDSLFFGLPKSIYVDCGKDFKASILSDPDFQQNLAFRSLEANTVLNELTHITPDLGLFDALDIRVYHALPYHPQSKSIERSFGTLESEHIRKLPGYCYNSPKKRPTNFNKQLKELHEGGQLLTLSAFVQLFGRVILPSFNQAVQSGQTQSPLELFGTLPKARDLVPNWKTMSILKKHRKETVLVRNQGILFRKQFFWDDALIPMIGTHVALLYHDVEPISSITVITNGQFVCEAFIKESLLYVGETPAKLQAHLDSQNSAAQEVKQPIVQLRRRIKKAGLDQLLYQNYYVQAVDENLDLTASDLLPDYQSPANTRIYSSDPLEKHTIYDRVEKLLSGTDNDSDNKPAK